MGYPNEKPLKNYKANSKKETNMDTDSVASLNKKQSTPSTIIKGSIQFGRANQKSFLSHNYATALTKNDSTENRSFTISKQCVDDLMESLPCAAEQLTDELMESQPETAQLTN